MKFRLLPAFPVAVAFSLAPAAEKLERRPLASDLVTRIGDESYPVRESATYELWAMGDEAKPLLEQALSSRSPEVVIRARKVLRKIDLGILPDSPPEVVELVVEYDTSSAEARLRIIRRLKELRAWRQVLKIHELEREPRTLALIAGEMAGVAVEAARELLASDSPDFSGARELLEMGRPEPAQLMALADFHRVAGSLEDELEKAASLEGQAGHLWRYALLAANGDLQGSAAEAEAAGMLTVGARLRAMDGDPLPWVKNVMAPPQQIPPVALDDYRDAVVDIWNGRGTSRELQRKLLEEADDGGVEDRYAALSVLYALGESDKATDLMEDLVPVLAFFHYENNERVDDAFKSLSLDPEEPDFKGWAAERFEEVLSDPEGTENAMSALATLGWFLERRGMDELASEIFVEPLAELGRRNPEAFLDKTNEFFSSRRYDRIVWPVLEVSARFAGEDPDKLMMVRDNLFGEGVHVDPLWKLLDRFDVEMNGHSKLDVAAEFLGLAPDLSKSFEKWWDKEVGEVGAGTLKAPENRIALMLALSAVRSDVARFLEAADLMRKKGLVFRDLGDIGANFRLADYELACMNAAGRWDEIVGFRQAASDRRPTDPIRRAYLSGALRNAGRVEEAKREEDVLERLVLGSVRSMRWIALAYGSCGDFDRASDWWWRAALQSTGTTQEFMDAAEPVLADAKERGNWKLVASLGEIQLMYHLMMGDRMEQPWTLLRARSETEMARALSILEGDRETALKMLERCHARGVTDGSMADYFFPALRSAGLHEQHDQWFEETWGSYQEVLERFPNSQNTRNTAAWTAARANRRLDEAEELVSEALEMAPNQAAYLDTLGEVWFCRGNREKALEWSGKALMQEPGEPTLMRQHHRFRFGEFPLK